MIEDQGVDRPRPRSDGSGGGTLANDNEGPTTAGSESVGNLGTKTTSIERVEEEKHSRTPRAVGSVGRPGVLRVCIPGLLHKAWRLWRARQVSRHFCGFNLPRPHVLLTKRDVMGRPWRQPRMGDWRRPRDVLLRGDSDHGICQPPVGGFESTSMLVERASE